MILNGAPSGTSPEKVGAEIYTLAEQKQTSTEKDDKKETKKDPAQKVEHKRQHKRKSD